MIKGIDSNEINVLFALPSLQKETFFGELEKLNV
jgi:hypothetical protein